MIDVEPCMTGLSRWRYTVRVGGVTAHGYRATEGEAHRAAQDDVQHARLIVYTMRRRDSENLRENRSLLLGG